MNESDIAEQLSTITAEEQLRVDLLGLIDRWSAVRIGPEVIGPSLHFLEIHPEWDFGMPGELVHFLERFYGRGYEQKLVESISRRPTVHTVWMLNRVINGEKLPEKKQTYLELLASVANASPDAMASERAREFLSQHDR
jgi:hypothetical protein